jgi:PmbA protein
MPKARQKNSLFYSENELRQLAKDILVQSKQYGATAAETAINTGVGFEVRVRNGEAEKVEHHQGKELGVTVYFGYKSGTAATTNFSPDAIKLAIEKACYIAKYTNDDLCSGLADRDLMAISYPDLDLYHHWDIDLESAIELATECEKTGLIVDKRIVNSEGADVSSYDSFRVYANTNDFIGCYPSSVHSISCALIGEQDGSMQVDYEYTAARNPKDLQEALVVGKSAAEKTIKKLGAKHLSTRECPVVFLNQVAKSLVGNFLAAINGNNLYTKSSFLLDHLQHPVFAKHINIEEFPHLKQGMNSVPFDEEGVKTVPRFFVEDGILTNYILNSYTGRKLNMQTTGNAGGVHNVFVTTRDAANDLNELLKAMQSGLLVTELLGQGVNLVTGDYSRGAFGFWVEKGEIQYPVESFTIAGNLKDMFSNIISIGNDVDNRGNIHIGSMLIAKMKIAGVD